MRVYAGRNPRFKKSKRVQKKKKEGKFKESQGVYDEGVECTRDSK